MASAATPTVSVVVTTYGRPEEAKRAVLSVLAQTYAPHEVIVVEDGSSSGVLDWVTALGRVDVFGIAHSENRGLAAARNTGLRAAHGDIVCFLDDDDEWLPQKLARQVAAWEQVEDGSRDRTIVYCAAEVRTLDGRPKRNTYPLNSGALSDAVRQRGASTVPSTYFLAREPLAGIGGFDESLRSSIDHDLWYTLAVSGYEAVALMEPLVVTYERRGRATMMGDLDRRMSALGAFAEKWTPLYIRWYGPGKGEARMNAYRARAIAMMAADKLLIGDWAGFRRASSAVIAVPQPRGAGVAILARRIVASALNAWMPWVFRLKAQWLR